MAASKNSDLKAFGLRKRDKPGGKDIDKRISNFTQLIARKTTKEEYFGGNRLVIGQGYEIKDILFPEEFTTICIRKLTQYESVEAARRIILNLGPKSVEIEIIKESYSCKFKVMATFRNKTDAKWMLEYLRVNKWMDMRRENIFPVVIIDTSLKTSKTKKTPLFLEMYSGFDYFWNEGKRVRQETKRPAAEISTFWLDVPAEKCDELMTKKFPYLSHSFDFVVKNFNLKENGEECGLCFNSCEIPFIQLSLCTHRFCLTCIKRMFVQQPPPCPVKCPQCEIPMALDDILQCANQRLLLPILQGAVQKYVQKYSKDICRCPSYTCGKILSRSSRSTGKGGGEFVFCDACKMMYCINCSTEQCKPVVSHEKISCQKNSQREISVSKYVRDIQDNVLNLRCPRCKIAFSDFEGCVALSCKSCSCKFCALCFKDCGNVYGHAHIAKCPRNIKNKYFLSEEQLRENYKTLRVRRILDYIIETESLDKKTLKNVLDALGRDLKDLGIDVHFFIPIVTTAAAKTSSNTPKIKAGYKEKRLKNLRAELMRFLEMRLEYSSNTILDEIEELEKEVEFDKTHLEEARRIVQSRKVPETEPEAQINDDDILLALANVFSENEITMESIESKQIEIEELPNRIVNRVQLETLALSETEPEPQIYNDDILLVLANVFIRNQIIIESIESRQNEIEKLPNRIVNRVQLETLALSETEPEPQIYNDDTLLVLPNVLNENQVTIELSQNEIEELPNRIAVRVQLETPTLSEETEPEAQINNDDILLIIPNVPIENKVAIESIETGQNENEESPNRIVDRVETETEAQNHDAKGIKLPMQITDNEKFAQTTSNGIKQVKVEEKNKSQKKRKGKCLVM